MKTVTILVPETAIPAAILDPRYMFTAVNDFYTARGEEPVFKVLLVGLSAHVSLQAGLITIHPDLLIDEVKHTDLIVIPALSGDIPAAIEANAHFIPWIVKMQSKGAEVASLCIGAFLLAATGLLEGKSCSTHWLYASQFRELFPNVNLVEDQVITDSEGIYSSGGATSYWNLLLYLVEKYTNREMAVLASKFFLLNIGLRSQSPYIMFNGQKNHQDQQIIQAQEYIETHYTDRITVDELCNQLSLGRKTFERRFKKATSNTVNEYIQRVKIEIAKKQLESGERMVNEVMYDVGYSDNKAFREIFKRITGLSPFDYRAKYSGSRLNVA